MIVETVIINQIISGYFIPGLMQNYHKASPTVLYVSIGSDFGEVSVANC